MKPARPGHRWSALAPALARLPRDKADTLLLLFAAVLVLAPHAAHLPPWSVASVAASLLWRAVITVRGTRLPPLWLLLPLSLLAMGGVYASFRTLLGREAGVAMLALLLAFKLLEMHAKRDLFVVVFLSFFLLLTNFFYSQSIATAAVMLLTIVVLLAAQLSFQYSGVQPPLARRLRLAGGIVGAAAPLALLLFVLFPRIEGPLWGLPGDSHSGRTGLSETMAPGAIANLAQSEEPAFRVRFERAAPPQRQLYWRGIVLGDYDGRTWTRLGAARRGGAPEQVEIKLNGPSLRYQVTLEPSGQRWLFALDLPERLYELDGNAQAVSPALEVMVLNPIAQRTRYRVSSVLDYALQADEPAGRMRAWLALPAGYNPRALAWAARTAAGRQPAEAIEAVLRTFRQERYFYTLQPPLLGRDAVDQFLFDSKAGFCEHYAGAFVVLMRAMGIPARVVTGYQGGEMNPVDGYLTVRQSDAHAWAEVWLAGRGWLRVDPTAAVAPERVERNLAGALPASGGFGLRGLHELMGGPGSLLATLRFNWNAVNNGWNQWVLDYNPQRQRGVLAQLGQSAGNWQALLGAALAGALLALVWALRRRRQRDPFDALYAAFCRQQARRGCARAPHEGPHGYAKRLAATAAPAERRAAAARFLAIYGAIKYGVASPHDKAAALPTLRRLLNQSR
ncbi:protein-glutamine gamma-glutamyltransferase [Janthinobacterium sp. CG_23.3]|uniref:transglutaminase family protein n=1 Tax=Janthinobacterium sp. CG_23.3 TaxID=3349634 RepID=UPI0038D3939C